MSSQGPLRFGSFTLDSSRRVLERDGQAVALTPRQFDTLEYMVRNPGRVLTKEELLKALWPDSFVEESNLSQNVFWLRKAFQSADPQSAQPDYILTVPGKGYRFVAEVTPVRPAPVDTGATASAPISPPLPLAAASRRSLWISAFAVLAIAMAGVLVLLEHHRRSPQISAAQNPRPIILAQFANTTSDPALTGPLSSVLRIGLAQSPYLTTFSRAMIRSTLSAMTLSPDTPLTPDLAAQVCRRHHAAAVVAGSVASVGSSYVVSLEASDCNTNRVFYSGQTVVQSKEEIVNALDGLLPDLRHRLGESVPSVQQFSIPIEQTTTASLEAFEAFAAGDDQFLHGDFSKAVPFYRKAIDLDPKFAMAYARLGGGYVTLGEAEKAAFYISRAYELRGPLSPRERHYIEATYVGRVTGDLNEGIRISESDRALYPLDRAPWQGESDTLVQIGRFSDAVRIGEEGLRRFPDDAVLHIALGRAYLRAGNFDGLKHVAEDAATRQLLGWDLHEMMWDRAVLVGDPASEVSERATVIGKPEEYQALDDDAFLNLRRGRAAQAEASQRAFIVMARRDSMLGYADVDVGNFAFVLEEIGLHRDAETVIHAWHPSANSAEIARGLAAVGDIPAAEALGAKLHEAHPQDTLISGWVLPCMRAAVLLHQPGEASARRAIEALQPSEALYVRDFYAPYLRGRAYMQLKQWDQAQAEFQRILDTPGGDPFSPLYPLALLQSARAQAKLGNAVAAKKSYTQLLALWQHADPTLPALLQSKTELAALN